MVWVPLADEGKLRSLLASMNLRPGVADPHNALVPFGRLERLHFARCLLLDDATLDDISVYGLTPVASPLSFAFLVDFDGDVDEFLDQLILQAGDGLRQLFACCGLSPGDGLRGWMKQHFAQASASYVNWEGRTVSQVREEAALRNFLCTYVRGPASATIDAMPVLALRHTLIEEVRREQADGRLPLRAPDHTPLGWKLRKTTSLLAGVLLVLLGGLLALLLLPLTILILLIYIVLLRRRERTDPEITPRPAAVQARRLAEIEDHDVTNQFSAMGALKPGWFRLLNISIGLAVIKWTTRHLFTRGHLARVSTIHFARWVFIGGRTRLLFASNYDGSLDSYMDDFINKVGFGLNLVFSNGIGYPRTNWLVLDGAKDEQKFKRYIRRHELPTEVWYNAHPGLTAADLARNSRIRDGLEKPSMTEAEARQWLSLL